MFLIDLSNTKVSEKKPNGRKRLRYDYLQREEAIPRKQRQAVSEYIYIGKLLKSIKEIAELARLIGSIK